MTAPSRRALQRARPLARAAFGGLLHNARDPSLRAAQTAYLAQALAKHAAAVGIGLFAYRAGGALALGAVGVLRTVPGALLAPLLSPLADRWRRERLLAGLGAGRAALFAAAAVGTATGRAGVVFALVAVWSVLSVLFRPVHSALLPSLCGSARELAGAQAARSLMESLAVCIGPLLATVLVAVGPLASVLAASSVLSAVGAVAALLVRYEAVPRDPAGGTTSKGVRAAFGLVARDRGLRLLLGLNGLLHVSRGAWSVLTVVLALDLYAGGEATAGWLTTAIGAGAVLGAVAAQPLRRSTRLAAWVATGIALGGAPAVLAVAPPPMALTAVLLGATGLGHAVVDIGLGTLPARLVRDDVLARVFTVFEVVTALGLAVGCLLTPLALDRLGLPAALLLAAGTGPLAVLLRQRGVRALDVEMTALDRRVRVLAGVPMLQPLPMPAVERLATRIAPRAVPAGGAVVVEGEVADDFFVLVTGRAEVEHQGELLRTLGPGDAFGEVALLRRVTRTATVRATTDLQLWVLDRTDFLGAVEGYSVSRAEAQALLGRLLHVPAPRLADDDDDPAVVPAC